MRLSLCVSKYLYRIQFCFSNEKYCIHRTWKRNKQEHFLTLQFSNARKFILIQEIGAIFIRTFSLCVDSILDVRRNNQKAINCMCCFVFGATIAVVGSTVRIYILLIHFLSHSNHILEIHANCEDSSVCVSASRLAIYFINHHATRSEPFQFLSHQLSLWFWSNIMSIRRISVNCVRLHCCNTLT